MPNSIMSRLSMADQPKSQMASYLAREAAQQEIRRRLATNQLDARDGKSIEREFKDIYRFEYYKNYAELMRQDQPPERVVYLATENPAARKFYIKHACASFTKTNCFIHVRDGCIVVGRVNFPLDDDISLDTKEAFLGVWPGPLDKPDDSVKRKTSDYIDTLWQHDSQRRIRYMNSSSDDQRRVILKLLTELLHRNGSLDASGITRLLLKPDQTEIQKDEGNRRPLETLQKYLLLGKRTEAIRFARSRKLWDHAQCLAFLDKYQPQNRREYVKDGPRLRDDSIVQLNDEYINSVDQDILNTVYRSLLNRILQRDPDSVNLVKHPNVANNAYEFAILSANDCEMDFDHSNEVFKLINAMKRTSENPSMSNSHLISLGYTTIDTYDAAEDLSYRSIISYRQNDTYASRTLTISNIDTLILNEIWEYCLNLARGTTDTMSYDYIFNLIPFKLVFASRLLDLGLHSMFAYYLKSIKNALIKIRQQPNIERDDFYDWETIEKSVECLSRVWDIFRFSPDTMVEDVQSYEPLQESMAQMSIDAPSLPPAFDMFQPQVTAPPAPIQPHESSLSHLDSSAQQYPWLPYQESNAFQPPASMAYDSSSVIAEEVPEPIQSSLPQHTIDTPGPPPAFDTFQPQPQPPALQPSQPPPPLTQQHEPSRTDQFDSPVQDPIWRSYQGDNEFLSSPMTNHESSNRSNRSSFQSPPMMSRDTSGNGSTRSSFQSPPTASRGETSSGNGPTKSADNQQSKMDEAQGAGLLANIAGSVRAFLPKSNSKQMILPDDSKPSIVFDKEKNTWIDTSKPEGENGDDYSEPPPVAAPVRPPPASYSYAAKSARNRYPRTQFEP